MLENDRDDAAVIVVDFGIAAEVSDSELLTDFIGTISYIAPEIVPSKSLPSHIQKYHHSEPYGLFLFFSSFVLYNCLCFLQSR
jgi:serine/threonine protein kinase